MATCAKLNTIEKEPVAILRSESFLDSGNFRYNFESEDGTSVNAEGSDAAEGGTIMSGRYSICGVLLHSISFHEIIQQKQFCNQV